MAKKRTSIRRKSLISHILTAAVAAFIFTIVAGLYSAHAIRTYFMDQTLKQCRSIAQRESSYGFRKNANYGQITENYQRLVGGTVIIVDKDGDTITSSLVKIENSDENELPLHPEEAVFHAIDVDDQRFLADAHRVLDGETVSASVNFSFSRRWVFYAGAPVHDADGNVLYAMFLFKPMRNLRGLRQQLVLIALLSLVVSMAVAIALSVRSSSMLSKPIVELTAAADHMVENEGDPPLMHTGTDEIGRLYEAFSELNDRVESSMESMRLERDRLNAIIDGMDDGILAVNAVGAIVHYNIALLEMLELRSFDELKASLRTNPAVIRLFKGVDRVLMTDAPEDMQWNTATKRSIHAHIAPVTGDQGIGVVCHLSDVSESERLEQMRRDYISNVSHELRTPLTGIRGLVEPLMDGVVDSEEERQEYYVIIDREARRLEALVGEMLDLSRLQSGSASVAIAPVSLGLAITEALQDMHPSAQQAGIRMEALPFDEGLTVMGDEAHIVQVLVVLLNNAIDFTPAGGSVTVSVEEDGANAVISVTDTGCGIEPKDLKYIWERFYKADRSRMRSKGTGLGLPIARSLVELMGGRIDVDTSPGRGSRFWFTLKKAVSD
ncbi:MAG: cell wall metabolism sensor histidine kinase WalK [Clostridiales bacterium]|nr:cell wall metabolism sensor histidine kinase WalK [Clostridiales bacterium]